MSKERKVIELNPPSYKGNHERIISQGHECEYCHGNGWFWGRDANWEGVKVTCPVCLGDKQMKAIVEITWLPNGSKIIK